MIVDDRADEVAEIIKKKGKNERRYICKSIISI